MRKYFIIFFITIFLGIISAYLMSSMFPFDKNAIEELVKANDLQFKQQLVEYLEEIISRGMILEYLNIKNVLLIGVLLTFTIFSSVFLIHIVIDKLFFKFAHEPPDIFKALRRSFLISVSVIISLTLKVFAYEWYLSIAVWIVAISIEMIILRLSRVKETSDTKEGNTPMKNLINRIRRFIHEEKQAIKNTVDKSKETKEDVPL